MGPKIVYMYVIRSFQTVISYANSPVLEVTQLNGDFLNVHITPEYIIVAVDSINHIVVQTIQLLVQIEFFLDLEKKLEKRK